MSFLQRRASNQILLLSDQVLLLVVQVVRLLLLVQQCLNVLRGLLGH